MALAGMHHQHAQIARRGQHGGDWLHRAGKLGDIVAQRFAEAAGLHEIALHVDDDERCNRPIEVDRLGFRGDCANWQLL